MSSLQCPTTLVLARHADTRAGNESGTQSSTGSGSGSLTALGRRQALLLADRLSTRRIAHVWADTSTPAAETGRLAAARLGVSLTLCEAPGKWTAEWTGEQTGESPGEVVTRLGDILEEIADAHRGETVLVVGHAEVWQRAVPLLARMDATPAPLGSCSLIEVDIDGDDRVCRSWDAAADVG